MTDTRYTVAHLRSAEFFGGPERAIIGQCTHLDGWRFLCMSFVRRGAPNVFLDRCQAAGLATEAIPERRAGDFSVVGRIREALRTAGVDILVSHDYKANVMGLLAQRGLGIAHIRYFRGFTWSGPKDRFYNLIDRQSMRRMRAIVAVSQRSAAILGDLGIDRRVVDVVPNAIERHKLVAADWTRSADRAGPCRFAVAGRLSFEKGQDVLIAALARIPASRAFHVDFYGDGPDRAALERAARDAGLAHRVTFHGLVPDVLEHFRAADGMILPSRSEGMPNVLLEAWAQKCPVISTTVGGVPEMVTDGESGLLCPPESPEQLARCITWAIDHRDAFAALGAAGHARVAEHYNYEVQSRRIRTIFQREYEGQRRGR